MLAPGFGIAQPAIEGIFLRVDCAAAYGVEEHSDHLPRRVSSIDER